MTSVVNVRKHPCTVFIGRPSKWGNPFKIYPVGGRTREQAIQQYREYIQKRPDLLSALPELKDQVLGCFCKPLACHGDVLVELLATVKKDT